MVLTIILGGIVIAFAILMFSYRRSCNVLKETNKSLYEELSEYSTLMHLGPDALCAEACLIDNEVIVVLKHPTNPYLRCEVKRFPYDASVEGDLDYAMSEADELIEIIRKA